ncbi:MAG: metallophosphoesterase [Sandaracinaceae bacterium]
MPLPLRIALFIAAVLVLIVGTSVYVHRRASALLRLGRTGKRVLAAVFVVGPISMMLARSLEPSLPREGSAALGILGATIVLGVWISTVLLWAVDVPAWLANRVAQFRKGDEASAALDSSATEPHAERAEPEEAPPADASAPALASALPLSRRSVLRQSATGAALSLGFGSSVYGSLFGRHDYDLHEVPIAIPGLPRQLDGYRIAQISDIHVGTYVGERELRSAVELMRRARPDLIVMTGDLVDHDVAYAPQLGRLVRSFSELPVRDGVAIIPGNHDYYAGVDEVLRACAEGGGRVLRNSGRLIGDPGASFGLIGVDDGWAERNGYPGGPDLDRALAMVPDDVPKVLLCHNPVFFPEARGRIALQLSGHTHGGQVNLGLRPAELVLDYVEGVYTEEGSQLYVNRGFGTAGPPSRVQAPPEVNVVVLTSA